MSGMRATDYLAGARRVADSTPPDRNRVVDMMRVVSILVVVFGHWLMAAVVIEEGDLVPGHLLDLADWTHPLTWILQVMPIFFFVGGYSNALSWRSAQRRGEHYGAWLRGRLRRLTLPVVPLLLVWGAGGWLAIAAGVDWKLAQMASQVAIVPTWFLAAYVVIVTLAPIALVIWERLGWWSIAGGLALSALTDILSIGVGMTGVGFLNYVFVWGTVHQLGYAWVGGAAEGWARRSAMAITGLVGILALVWAGPYPVAMVGLDTAGLTNSFPPRVTLAFLGLFQAGLVLLAEPKLAKLMQRPRPWTGVVAISSQIMTLYLWHMTAMVLAIGAGLVLDGRGFGIAPTTAGWWLSRPVWLVVLAGVTVLLAAVFGRYERPSPDRRPAPRSWRPLIAAVMVCAGLGGLAVAGIADADGVNGILVTLPVAGLVAGGVLGARWQGDRRAKTSA